MVALNRKNEIDELRAQVQALELELSRSRHEEEHAKLNRERYERLLSSLVDGCLIFDRGGHFVEANHKAEDLFGYSPGHLRQLRLTDVQPGLDLERYCERLEHLLPGDVVAMEVRPKRGDGIPIVLEMRIGLFQETPAGRRYIALLRDITDNQQFVRALSADSQRFRRRLEEYQSHLVKVERLATFGTLGAAVGHELNNLGQVFMAAADLLALRRSDPTQIDHVVAELRQATELLSHHAKHLLAAGRPSPTVEEHIDVGRQIEDTVHLLRRAGKLKRTRLEVVAPMGSTYVQMSRCRLEQVIINLLTNAAEALADSTGKATIRAEEDNGEVIITVADEGRGIQQAEIPRVFDAYFSTKDNHLGLGLLVVRQIARDYGGYAAIESRPGQGTQVRCVLPAAEGPSSGSIPAGWDLPPRPPRSRSGQRRKVSDQGQGGR